MIREFKNQNPALEMHINTCSTGKSSIPIHSSLSQTTIPSHSMSNVNVYYLGSPKHIFGAELDSGLITLDKAHELCAKKYVQPHITDKNEIATPLTQQEMEQIKLQFPEVVKRGMPPYALSPMVR